MLDATKKLRLAYLEEDEDKIILKFIMNINPNSFWRCWMPLRS